MNMDNSEIIKIYDLEGDGDLGIAVDKALDEARLSERSKIEKLILEHRNCDKYHTIKNERGFGEDATCLDFILSQLKEMK